MASSTLEPAACQVPQSATLRGNHAAWNLSAVLLREKRLAVGVRSPTPFQSAYWLPDEIANRPVTTRLTVAGLLRGSYRLRGPAKNHVGAIFGRWSRTSTLRQK